MCMRARGFFIAVCCYAATLSATVMPFSNFERDGRPVLVPGVQNYRSEAGSFALPRKFTVSVPAGEEIILEQRSSPCPFPPARRSFWSSSEPISSVSRG